MVAAAPRAAAPTAAAAAGGGAGACWTPLAAGLHFRSRSSPPAAPAASADCLLCLLCVLCPAEACHGLPALRHGEPHEEGGVAWCLLAGACNCVFAQQQGKGCPTGACPSCHVAGMHYSGRAQCAASSAAACAAIHAALRPLLPRRRWTLNSPTTTSPCASWCLTWVGGWLAASPVAVLACRRPRRRRTAAAKAGSAQAGLCALAT